MTRWWESRAFLAAALIVSVIPLLWPTLPPLSDLSGHIGRYHIASAIGGSADLARHWAFEWALIGNLGVDLLVHALAPLIGVETAARLVVMLIPPLWVSGLMLLGRAADGRLSPAAAFAFPLAFGFPFQFGFVNFMLAAGLALHALALWIWLGRRGWILPRAALFVPIACVLWVAHSFGWAMFGLFAFATEVVRLRDRGWPSAILWASIHCIPLALPFAAMIGGAAGEPWAWDWTAKLSWLPSLLRERWKGWDVACAILLFGMLWMAVRDNRLRFDPLIGVAALAGFLAFLALPRLALGGAYVDMRMLAPAVALALVAIRVKPNNDMFERRLALAAALFLILRTITSTAAMILFAEPQAAALAAVPHIPRGAAVLVLVNQPCTTEWADRRLGHVAGIAVARRDTFENGQWTIRGQQPLRHRHPGAEPYAADPSQLVYPESCDFRQTRFGAAIRDFDRATFNYVWTLDFPAQRRLAPDVKQVWSNGVSTIYAVDRDPSRLPVGAAPQ